MWRLSDVLKTGRSIVSDPRLIHAIQEMEIEKVTPNDKKRQYFEFLRKWKGFIKVSIDITTEFNEFQERLKKEFVSKDDNENDINEIEWDNRKYFLNNKEMPFLKYNEKENKIMYESHVLLDSGNIQSYHSKFDFFKMVSSKQEREILSRIFSLLNDRQDTLRCVCTNWNAFFRWINSNS